MPSSFFISLKHTQELVEVLEVKRSQYEVNWCRLNELKRGFVVRSSPSRQCRSSCRSQCADFALCPEM